MKFSQRKGYTPVSSVIQIDAMSDELRSSLWNVIDLLLWEREKSNYNEHYKKILNVGKVIWFGYFKTPLDQIPNDPLETIEIIRNYFFGSKWYEVYDFLEFLINNLTVNGFQPSINMILERELSGYRFIDGVFTDITDAQEVQMLEDALSDNDFPQVRAHLRRALELLSDKEKPDYRNSIKESISAVESLVCTITKNPKATLGDALNVIGKSGKIHPALAKGFSNLYGYTSDENGIRLAMLDEPNLTTVDAKFFLLSCSSFIGYLKAKI